MAKDPAFPFYAQDFLTGVMHLTMEERGIYITLLAYQWAHNSIPKKRLGFIVGLSWENIPQELKDKFQDTGENLINSRLEAERERRRKFKEKQAVNGKKGGRPSKTKKPNDTQSKSQKNPLEHEHEHEHESKGGNGNEIVYPFDDPKFLAAWENYKAFRKEQHNFMYKSIRSEQGKLTELSNLSNGSSEIAIAIIMQSISEGWKGLFPLKNKKDDQQTNKGAAAIASDILRGRRMA